MGSSQNVQKRVQRGQQGDGDLECRQKVWDMCVADLRSERLALSRRLTRFRKLGTRKRGYIFRLGSRKRRGGRGPLCSRFFPRSPCRGTGQRFPAGNCT